MTVLSANPSHKTQGPKDSDVESVTYCLAVFQNQNEEREKMADI